MRIAAFANFVLSFARGLSMRRAFVATVTIVTSAFIAGCGSQGGGVTPPPQLTAQTITFTQPTSPVTYAASLTVSLSATGGGSGNAVVFSVDSASTGKGTISGNTLTVTGAGNLVIDANQSGNSTYSAAPEVQKTVVVSKAMPTVNCPAPAPITAGTALSSTQLDCTASVAGTFAYTLAGNVPALGAIPPVGTDTITVTFTPTDATDYASVTTSMQLVVNPATAQITALTPRYVVADTMSTALTPYTITCAGCEEGDIFHDASGLSYPDLTDPYPTGTTSFGISFRWQQGAYEPWFTTWEIQHPSGPYGNQASTAFLGSASQSTLAVSPTTGTLFQVEQKSGQVDWQKSDGTTGTWFSSVNADTPIVIAADDATGNVVSLGTGTSTAGPGIDVYPQMVGGNSANLICFLTNTGMSFISSIAAKGGYMVFTDPVENLIGIAKMDCTGYFTISIAGQPWSVAMTNNGTEIDAYVLSRDKASPNGLPILTKIGVPFGTTEGWVELVGVTPVSTLPKYEDLYQIQAFSLSPVAAVLFMSGPNDGKVLIINTNTSSGAKMGITYTTPVTDLPIGITAQESTSSSTPNPTLWVSYIAADTMDAVTHVGAINPTTGNYTPAIGAFPAGILAGGVVGVANGNGTYDVYGAMGSTITAPLVLQP